MHRKFDSTHDWLNFDKQHLWHPYTSMTEPLPCYPVVAAKGVHLELADGRQLIDGMASWWSAIHGYQHPAINKTIIEQSQTLSHVMFGGIAHPAASELGARLVELSPDGLDYVFLADSGSVSVEVALKMALQFHLSQGNTHKNQFMTLRGGYHGDLFECMSVSDPENGMHNLFQGRLSPQHFGNKPSIAFGEEWQTEASEQLEAMFEQYHAQSAAFIIEPIVQGAGGMWFYHPNYLSEIRRLCYQYDVLLIADEIATGFGRTGRLFACEHAAVLPDILCLGKALTGGTLTLAATLANKRVAHGVSSGDFPVLMHGPTFMANPLACAVACTSIDTLMGSDWQANIHRIEHQLKLGLTAACQLDAVADVRTLGAIGVIECQQPLDLATAQAAFVALGVWVRPFGRLVYIMPPYITTNEQLATLCAAMVQVIREHRF